MEWIIDRFEDDYAVVLKDDESFNVLKKYLPQDIKEGSVLKITLDKDTTELRLKKATDKMNSIFK